MYYWIHRFLHWKKIYRYIHKIHHEYSSTVSIAAAYVHPIEYLLEDLIPARMGSKILGIRCHFSTFMIWGAIRLLGASEAHSGYEFPWSPYNLPFFRTATFHNYHHTNTEGNYGGTLPIWDYICGTNVDLEPLPE